MEGSATMTTLQTHPAHRAQAPSPIPAPYAGTAGAVVAIWLGVLAVSLFSPDLITGAEQDHIALPAIFAWIWGAIATAFVVMPVGLRRNESTADGWWYALAAVTAAIWLGVALVSILTPREVTGSDPTQNPVGAMAAPIVGMIGTALVAGFVALIARGEQITATVSSRPVGRPRAAVEYASTAAAVLAVWAGVALTSIFAPDLVTGTEQDHFPVAAIVSWIWGLIATAFLLWPVLARNLNATRASWWYALAFTTAGVWLAVTLVSVFAPVLETGSDPTRLPFGAILAPIAGMFATAFAAGFVAVYVPTEEQSA
jgi:hypothetical protein